MEQDECVLVHEDPSDNEMELDERIQHVQDSSDMDRWLSPPPVFSPVCSPSVTVC